MRGHIYPPAAGFKNITQSNTPPQARTHTEVCGVKESEDTAGRGGLKQIKTKLITANESLRNPGDPNSSLSFNLQQTLGLSSLSYYYLYKSFYAS